MGSNKSDGFTIIEVMLFLAISSLMFVGMLVGFQTAIQNQRYIDSITSFKGFIQSQYAQVFTTVNDRADRISCDRDAMLGETTGAPSRGMSECFIIGRYIASNADADQFIAGNVLATQIATTDQDTDRDDLVHNYRFRSFDGIEDENLRSYLNTESYTVGWGGKIVKNSGDGSENTPASNPFKMLIIRSPKTGMLLTFFDNSSTVAQHDLKTIATDYLNTEPKYLCMLSTATTNGRPLSGPMMAVKVNAGATNQNGVEIPPQAEAVCN